MSAVVLETEHFTPPLQLEVIHGDGEKLAKQVGEAIDRQLCRYEQFAPDSSLYQTVSARLDILTDGENIEKPNLIITHDDKDAPNAFATPGYIVINSSMLKALEYQEELDGLLAHELTHLAHEHVEKSQNKSRLEHIGHTRAHEFEADIRPLELLDRKDINPYGIISLFNRFEKFQKPDESAAGRPGQAKGKPVRIDDFEHGNLVDRRVNIEETLRIADVRHLSPGGLTPLDLKEEDFDGYQHDKDLLESYDLLPVEDKRRLLVRQLRSDTVTTEAERQEILSRVGQLASELAPDLEPTDQEVIVNIFDKQYRPPSTKHDDDPDNNGSNSVTKVALPPEELVGRLSRIVEHSKLREHRLVEITHESALATAAALSDSIKAHGRLPEIQPYTRLVHLFDEGRMVKPDIIWLPAIEYVCANPRSLISQTYTLAMADHTPIPTYELYAGNTVEAALAGRIRTGGLPEEQPRDIVLLQSQMAQRRISHATKTTIDAVDLMVLAANFGSDNRENFACNVYNPSIFSEYDRYGSEITEHQKAEKRNHRLSDESDNRDSLDREDEDPTRESEEVNSIVQAINLELSSLSASELIEIVRFHRQQGVLKGEKSRGFAAVLWQEIRRSENFNESSYSRVRPLNLLKEASFKEQLTLAGLLADKSNFLEFANDKFIRESSAIYDMLEVKGQEQAAAKLFLGQLKDIFGVQKAVRRLGFENHWQVEPIDLAGALTIQETALQLVTCLAKAGQIKTAAKIASLVPLPTLDHVRSNANVVQQWQTAVEVLLKHTDQVRTHELMLLACLSTIAPEFTTRLNIPPVIVQEITRQLPFDQAVDFVCDGLPSLSRHLFLPALNELIEERASSPDEMALLAQKLGDRLLEFVDENSPTLGKLSLIDGILLPNYGRQKGSAVREVGVKRDVVHGLEARELLLAMLSSARNDEQLQKYLLERWWGLMRTNREGVNEEEYPGAEIDEVTEAFKIEDIMWLRGDAKKARRMHWIASIPANQPHYKPFAEVVDNSFSGGVGMKYFLLRKLLLDTDYGVLRSEEDRTALIEQFLVNWLENPSDEAGQFVRESLESLTEVTDPELLYQHLYPLLMDIVLLPPEERTETKKIAYELAGNLFNDMFNRGQFGLMQLESAEAQSARSALEEKVHSLLSGEPQLRHDLEADIRNRVLQNYAERIKNALGSDDSTAQIYLKREIMNDIELELERERQKFAARQQEIAIGQVLRTAFTPKLSSTTESKRLSALDLLFTLGERSGALGTRMLQLGGMYFDLPDEQREKFVHVYDNMKGQTRLQAWQTLKREAEHSPYIKDLVENLVELKPRIGGGSLMTVYEGIDRQGQREAIAVKNPNIEYHLSKIVLVLDRMLEDLNEKRADEYRIGLTRSLLDDVAQWIHDELADPNFETKDQRFRAINDFREGNYKPSKNRYRVLVPKAIATGTRWVRREEYIEGRNLAGLEIVDADTNIAEGKINTKDYRQAISLLVHNYMHQLTESGLVHSDVHPGNFRITEDNQSLAIFDRYNLLEFGDDERKLMRQVLRTVASGNVASGLGQMVNFIVSLPENNQTDRLKVQETVESFAGQTGDLTETGPKVLMALKQSGIHVPIRYTLVMKNILSLQRLSKRAGFNGIADAFLASAKPTEILRLMT